MVLAKPFFLHINKKKKSLMIAIVHDKQIIALMVKIPFDCKI